MVSTECHFRNAYMTHDNVECLHPWKNIQVEQAHLEQTVAQSSNLSFYGYPAQHWKDKQSKY